MKKLFALILALCMVFSVTASLAEADPVEAEAAEAAEDAEAAVELDPMRTLCIGTEKFYLGMAHADAVAAAEALGAEHDGVTSYLTLFGKDENGENMRRTTMNIRFTIGGDINNYIRLYFFAVYPDEGVTRDNELDKVAENGTLCRIDFSPGDGQGVFEFSYLDLSNASTKEEVKAFVEENGTNIDSKSKKKETYYYFDLAEDLHASIYDWPKTPFDLDDISISMYAYDDEDHFSD